MAFLQHNLLKKLEGTLATAMIMIMMIMMMKIIYKKFPVDTEIPFDLTKFLNGIFCGWPLLSL